MVNEVIKVLSFLKKRPMLLLAIIASVSVLLIYHSFFTTIIFSALCIVFIFVLIYKKQGGVFIFCGVWLLTIILSSASCLSNVDRISKMDDMTVSGEFVAVTVSENKKENYLCVVEVLESPILKKGDRLQATYTGPEIRVGQSFKANAHLSALKNESTARSYYSERIYSFADMNNIVLTDNDDFILTKTANVRNFIKEEIFKFYGKDEAATMLALLTGDRTYLSDSFYSNIKGAGVMHVMVVSGMHLSIIVALMLYLVNKFVYNRFLKSFVIFLTVLAVAAVCGFTMSILRAGITYLLIALSLLLNRQSNSANSLGAAISVILLFNPMAVFSVALQLSALSTFGILSVAIPVTKFLNEKNIIRHKIISPLVSAVLITVSALILTLPVTITVFGYVSNMAVVTNLLISLATTVALCLCIIGFIFFPLRGILFYLSNVTVSYINAVINLFGSSEFATTDMPLWSAYFTAVVIFLIFYVIVACAKRDYMLKLKGIVKKKITEGGKTLKWQSFMKKR